MALSNLKVGLLVLILLMGISFAAQAVDQKQSDAVVMMGEDPYALVNLSLSPKLELTTRYDTSEAEDSLKLGVIYQFSDRFGLQAGVRYDTEAVDPESELLGYGGFNYSLPLGNNLRVTGFYTNNYEDEDWVRYESAIRIQMYPDHYLYVGVRGDTGDGAKAQAYSYNPDQEPLVFMRGDFSWQWNKFSINLRPLLHIKGSAFHDYDFKYAFNDQSTLVLNMSSLYDRDIRFRLGLQYKF